MSRRAAQVPDDSEFLSFQVGPSDHRVMRFLGHAASLAWSRNLLNRAPDGPRSGASGTWASCAAARVGSEVGWIVRVLDGPEPGLREGKPRSDPGRAGWPRRRTVRNLGFAGRCPCRVGGGPDGRGGGPSGTWASRGGAPVGSEARRTGWATDDQEPERPAIPPSRRPRRGPAVRGQPADRAERRTSTTHACCSAVICGYSGRLRMRSAMASATGNSPALPRVAKASVRWTGVG